MELYSTYRRSNSQKNTLKKEIIAQKSKKKKIVRNKSVTKKIIVSKNKDLWLSSIQKRWADIREKTMAYFFPESIE